MRRLIGGCALALAAWAAACRLIPPLAALWQRAALPALKALHRGTAGVPFPVIEPLALILLCLGLGRRGARRLTAALMAMVGVYLMLWYPCYWARPAQPRGAADARAVEALCGRLIDALNGPAPAFEGGLAAAGEAAGLRGARVKAARYPEWMGALGLSGLFSPWTGEVIVNPEAYSASLPFTCVHELMHLRGVADEGEANIAAYRACLEEGGAFAWSARLWTLRCALDRLSRLDPVACRQALARVSPGLARQLTPFSAAKPNPLARLLGIARPTSDYDALIDWLCLDG